MEDIIQIKNNSFSLGCVMGAPPGLKFHILPYLFYFSVSQLSMQNTTVNYASLFPSDK